MKLIRPILSGMMLAGIVLPIEAANALPEIAPVKGWRAAKAESVKNFEPVLEESSIRFGSKTIQMKPNGSVSCVTPEAGVVLTAGMAFWLVENGKPDWSWQERSFDKARSKFYRSGRKYTWELWYSSSEIKPFPGITQILEVLEDGRVSLSAKYTLPRVDASRRFNRWTLTFGLPQTCWMNETVQLDGKKIQLPADLKKIASRQQPQTEWIFGENAPAKWFSISCLGTELAGMNIFSRNFMKEYRLCCDVSKRKDGFIRVFLDFRKGGTPGEKGDVRGGVNFRKQENMQLPDNSHRNLVVNPSFERGLEDWHWQVPFNITEPPGWIPFELDEKVAWDGRNSLRFNAVEGVKRLDGNPDIGPTQIIAGPGRYTLSFYARCEAGKNSMICIWIPNFHFGPAYRTINGNTAKWEIKLVPEWKRYQVTFEVKPNAPLLFLGFYGRDFSGGGSIWLDAVQLEKAGQASAFQAPPAEGRLLTSSPDNFISSKAKINGRLRITTAKPDMSGTVRVTVKNFFDETLLDMKKDFRTGPARTAELKLPLDELPGLGLFVVKAEYRLKDGSSAYDYRRYSKVEFQSDLTKPNKRVFGLDYSNTGARWYFYRALDRWRKLGVGAKHHVGTLNRGIWETYEKYGIKPCNATMLVYQRDFSQSGSRVKHFFILDSETGTWHLEDVNDPRILVRDFHLDSNGTITPEYLAKLKQAAKTKAAKYPHVWLWALGGELTGKLPNDWWGPNLNDRQVIGKLALLLKAFAEGVREGNPKAKVYQDDPMNMSPKGGIAETDILLDECNKIGLRFDMIAIHPYRYSPENPDTDSDAQKFLEMLDKRGYGKTPVLWPEGMHWGPYEIPQWGTKASTWNAVPETWRRSPLTYDMGWTEKKTAAWYARTWLVALKYSDRVLGATSGQTINNCYMDVMLTPYAAQLMPNTLCAILGDAKFKKDIRFAPYVRTYVFEDAQKRPVVAVWCHKEELDAGTMDSPVAAADFGGSLESVLDLMNSKRAVKPGRMEFPVGPFPLFFRGKPGTLDQIVSAFEKAEIVSGSAISPLSISVNPLDAKTARVTFQNFVSREYAGKFNGRAIRIPASSQTACDVPLPVPLKTDAITEEKIPVKLQSKRGAGYESVFTFEAFAVKRVPDGVTIDSLNWSKMPAVKFVRNTSMKNPASGLFRIGWNNSGIFLESVIRDAKFVHVEYPIPTDRWKNDCLQIYFDTFANARQRSFKGYDEDDYDYAIFPNSKGDAAQVFRYRTVDTQLGLATQAPPDRTFAPDIPCRFSSKNGVLTYRVFFPAKYLLPIKPQKGWVFGFGLYAANSDQRENVVGALTLAADGSGCFNRPHTWPVAVLTE